MMSILAAFLTLTNLSASTCATIDNATNSVSWNARDGRIVKANYRDQGGARLIYIRPVPLQVRQAEATLTVGKRKHKRVTVCS